MPGMKPFGSLVGDMKMELVGEAAKNASADGIAIGDVASIEGDMREPPN